MNLKNNTFKLTMSAIVAIIVQLFTSCASKQQITEYKIDEVLEDSKIDNKIDEITALLNSFVYVQGGSFSMGDTFGGGDKDEKPVHNVHVSSFSIGKYEVTQAQWQAVMGSNPSEFKNCDNCPVEFISWNAIQKFIKKLQTITGKSFRLPTEAEWEYAARGGNRSKGYKYAGSNNIDNVAWYAGEKTTHPVGQKQPNELGLYDMSGNVWEWCQDWHANKYYKKSKNSLNPKGPSSGDYRILRGGSWTSRTFYCRIADRGYDRPDHTFNNSGFRLVAL